MKKFSFRKRKYAAASEHIIFVQKLCNCFWTYFCAETEIVQLIFFYIEDCMTASRNISMFFNEHAAVS